MLDAERAALNTSPGCEPVGWVFPCVPAQVPVVRARVESVLADHPRRDDVAFVAGEFAANTTAHSVSRHGGEFAVEVYCGPDRLELHVHDGGSDDSQSQVPRIGETLDSLEALDMPGLPVEAFEHGRGLLLVAGFCDEWGHLVDEHGCTAWATFILPIDTQAEVGDGSEESTATDEAPGDTSSGGPGTGHVRAVPHTEAVNAAACGGGITRPSEAVLRYLLGAG